MRLLDFNWIRLHFFLLVLGVSLIHQVEANEPEASRDKLPSANPSTTGSITFETDIQPLLTRFGCNAGACHGKSRGQNGFALSLLGFDSEFDYASIVLEGRGRRISTSSPDTCLLLQKATGQVPHGGGIRFDRQSAHYSLIRDWVLQGAPRTPTDAPKLLRISIDPASRSLGPDESFSLKVFAEYSDGQKKDVTDGCAFQTNDKTIASVSGEGRVQAGVIPGETAIMVRYMNNIAVCSITIPLAGNVPDEQYAKLPRQNDIDDLVWRKLKVLGMLPSPQADDATFHRRAFLRVIGRLPTPDETRSFLADGDPNKRIILIDRLLERPEYADYWANKWTDLLRPNPFRAGMKATWT
ncbi:MAG: DUF1549 domain-containing protein, partial [Planctomycetes bacterium]|nr:DUF1549 domain-containing protein [Planctomycetota bacterium]